MSQEVSQPSGDSPQEQISSGYTTGRLEQADIPAYVEVIHEGIRALPSMRDRDKERAIAFRSAEYYEQRVGRDDWILLAAKDADGVVVGGMEVEIEEGNQALIKFTSVAPAAKGRDIGKKLSNTLEEMLLARNILDIVTYVDPRNKASMGLRLKTGFRRIDPYRLYPDGAKLQKTISPK